MNKPTLKLGGYEIFTDTFMSEGHLFLIVISSWRAHTAVLHHPNCACSEHKIYETLTK